MKRHILTRSPTWRITQSNTRTASKVRLAKTIAMQKLLGLSAIFALSFHYSIATDTTRNPELIAKLTTAATQLDRLALLPSNEDWTFDFTAQKTTYNFKPGGVSNMNAATFPAAKFNGLTCK